jgi:hypothetical protein
MRLQIRISAKGKAMNGRIATHWLPALINLAAAMSFLTMVRQFGIRPNVVWVEQIPMALYVPWLAALPLFGAATAYLARRAGGRFVVCVTAGLFPAVILSGLGCIGLIVIGTGDQLDRSRWLYVSGNLPTWEVFPTLALLVGIASFLRMGARKIAAPNAEMDRIDEHIGREGISERKPTYSGSGPGRSPIPRSEIPRAVVTRSDAPR